MELIPNVKVLKVALFMEAIAGTPIFKAPQTKVPKPVIEAFVLMVAAFSKATAPLTVNVTPEAIVKPEAALELLLKFTEATILLGVEFTVTTSPALMNYIACRWYFSRVPGACSIPVSISCTCASSLCG